MQNSTRLQDNRNPPSKPVHPRMNAVNQHIVCYNIISEKKAFVTRRGNIMLAVETILGALTGYLTNDIAIRQLFSKNGIVVREREQFTDLLVRVLKEQILSEDIIIAMRENPDIIALFDETLKTLLTDLLPQCFSAQTLEDLDGLGDLKKIINEHLLRIDFSDITIHAAYLHQEVENFLKSEGFKTSFLHSLEALGNYNLEDLGFKDYVGKMLTSLQQLSDEEWQCLIEAKTQEIYEVVVKNLKSNANHKIWSLLEGYELKGAKIWEGILELFGLKNLKISHLTNHPTFQEFFFAWTERFVPELFDLHFQSLLDAFYPLIKENRGSIEQKIKESIQEANPQATLLNEAALGMTQQFFENDKEGHDWVTRLYLKYSEEKEQYKLCSSLIKWIRTHTLQSIDKWRHNDTEELLIDNRWFKKGSLSAIHLLDYFIENIQQSEKLEAFLANALKAFNKFTKKHLTADGFSEWLNKLLENKWSIPINELFHHRIIPEKAYEKSLEWWTMHGESYIQNYYASLVNDVNKEAQVARIVDKIYQVSLEDFFKQGIESVPFEEISMRGRKFIFSHISEFLGILTRKQLEQLSREDIRRLTLDMIGREMKPLSYLGGAIGAIAGATTSAALQISGMQLTVDQVDDLALLLAARSGMYGAVGYGTNVMAIKGLFWPYKKVLCFQGLISTNQERFAKKMQALTSNYVINDFIWEQQIQRVADLYEAHHVTWIAQAFHAMNQRRTYYIQPYYNSFLSKQLVQFLEKTYSSPSLAQKMIVLKSTMIQKLIKNQDFFSIDEASQSVWQRVLAKIYYAEYSEEQLSKSYQDIIQSIHIGKRHQQLIDALDNDSFSLKEKHFESLRPWLGSFYESLPEKIILRKERAIDKIDDKLQRKLSFPLQLAYKIVGGKKYIEKVFACFVEKKLPTLLRENQKMVEHQVYEWFKTSLCDQSPIHVCYPFTIRELHFIHQMIKEIPDQYVHERVLLITGQLGQNQAVATFIGALVKYIRSMGVDRVVIASALENKRFDEWMLQLVAQTQKEWQPMVDLLIHQLSMLSLAKTISMSEEEFWQYINRLIECDEDEKKIIIDFVHHLLTIAEPILFNYTLAQGKRFIEIVGVPNLSYQSVCALSPEALEELVREIAQPYFTHVERMGWMGAVVAVPATMLSMTLGNI